MNADQIRSELLEQHRQIRVEIERTVHLADRARHGDSVRDELMIALSGLARIVGQHNAQEEHLLGDVLGAVDAWGWVRTEFMSAAHADEHDEIYDSLVGVPATIVEFAGSAVEHALERLLAHMALEEKTFLNAQVLRDDSVAIDAVGG